MTPKEELILAIERSPDWLIQDLLDNIQQRNLESNQLRLMKSLRGWMEAKPNLQVESWFDTFITTNEFKVSLEEFRDIYQ